MTRFFVVEDEMMVVMLLEDMLGDLGHQSVGTAQRLEAATKAAACVEADAAILDVNLAGDLSFPVADILQTRKIPFMFATGYGRVGLEDRFPDAVVIAKPFTLRQLETAISQLQPVG